MSWRERCGGKLVELETAIKHIRSGDVVAIAPYTTTPFTLCQGLIEYGRRGGVKDVRVDHLASLASWTEPDLLDIFELGNICIPDTRTVTFVPELGALEGQVRARLGL